MRQLRWQDRGPRYRSMAFGNDPDPYDPERSRLSDRELLALALGPLDAQRSSGGTLLLSTFHLADATRTRGREVELALAGLAVAHFRSQRMDEPPQFAINAMRREIYATIAVRLSVLGSARARRELADAYLALGADGIWVKIAGFNERASAAGIRAAAAFLGALREGGVPVACCGAGQLYLALLVDEISASIGLSEGQRFLAPRPRPGVKAASRTRMRTQTAYNATLHRSFKVDSRQAEEAFAAAVCDCGEHEPGQPPAGRAMARHAAVLRARQAGEALSGPRELRRERLLSASTRASWTAADAGIPGARAMPGLYRAVFEGLDSAGVERPLGGEAL